VSSDDHTEPVTEPAEPAEPAEPDGGPPAERSGPDLVRAALARAKEQARARGVVGSAARRRVRPPADAARTGDRDPTPFGTAIRELLAERGWERTEQVATVMGRWEEIVGPDLAAHCRPESLRGGELVVVAESTAWATQLRLLTATLLARIATDVGTGLVTSVRVHGPTTPSWRKGPRRVTGGRGPRDTYG
jgi:predicted nucleic acid-binding Zn ribbon protein